MIMCASINRSVNLAMARRKRDPRPHPYPLATAEGTLWKRNAEKPLTLDTATARVILDGRKTQTRRLLKPRYGGNICPHGDHDVCEKIAWRNDLSVELSLPCPFGRPGDRLWVREAWAVAEALDSRDPNGIFYRADGTPRAASSRGWRAASQMPRWASRMLLQITAIRAERLQRISEADASAEGFAPALPYSGDARERFARAWRKRHGRESWQADPWVWVIEFAAFNGNEALST